MKYFRIRLLLAALTASLFAEPVHYANHLLFSLPPEREPLTAEECTSMQTPDPQLNKLIKKFNAVKLEPWLTNARPDERDGDLYLNRIYRLVLRSDTPASLAMTNELTLEAPSVAHAELEPIMRKYAFPDDPYNGYQWFLSKTRAREAWSVWDTENGEIPGSREIVIAVVDDGVEYTHPDLWQNIWINQDEIPEEYFALIDTSGDGFVTAEEAVYFCGDDLRDVITILKDGVDNDGDGAVDNIIGWDTGKNSGDADDDNNPMPVNNSHGTHVSGLAGAVTHNGVGVASVASHVSIMPVKASADEDSNSISSGYDGILHAARAGADIINCSWGGDGQASTYAQGVINTAYNTYGSLIVAAAGNGDDEGGPSDAYHYPSGYQNVISVTAVSSQDKFSWANYGAANPAEGFYGVDIAAPGESMYSTYLTKISPYTSLMGTSMASPLVASCLALIKSVYPDSSNEWLTARLLDQADPIDDINPDYAGQLGSGRVNVLKSLMYDQWPYLSYVLHTELITSGDADSVMNPGETLRIRVELENEPGWSDASQITGVLRSPDPGVEIIDSLSTWNSIPQNTKSFSDDEGFLIHFSDELLTADYSFELALTADPGSPKPYRKNLDLTISLYLDQQHFPFMTESTVEKAPLLLDIDGNGKQDMIFADKNGELYIINNQAEVRPGFPVSLGAQPGGIAVADIDNDGTPDIVATTFNKKVHVYDINGQHQWTRTVGGYITAVPAIGNLDDDPELEIVFGAYDQNIYVLNHDSSDVDGFPVSAGQNIRAGVALADISGNGRDEIIVAGLAKQIGILSAEGDTLDGWPQTTSAAISSEPQLVMNSNGTPVILIANDIGDMYAYDPDGTQRFMIDGSGAIKASPAVFTHQNTLYAAYGSSSGNLYLLDVMNNGIAEGWPKEISPVHHALACADVLPDGINEQHILVMGNDGRIRAFDILGNSVPGFPINIRSLSQSGLSVADIDADGDNEIICGTYSGISVIDLKSDAGEIAWSMHRGELAQRGSLTLLFSALAELDLPQDFDLQLLGNHPNPFNPQTKISYRVSGTEPVRFRIFALDGRQIMDKTIAYPATGDNHILVNMSTFPSGIYMYSLTQRGHTATGKMAFVK
jgi:hypothetical protein